MKIKVVFKLNKNEGYDNTKFVYTGYDGVEVNDIVVVNTRYGYAIAKVTDVDVQDEVFFDETKLATVEKIIESAEMQRKEQAKKDAYNQLVQKIKRTQMEKVLLSLGLDSEEQNLIKGMTDIELKTFYNAIMK